MKIVVTRRTADVHACIEGEPEIWDCGRTFSEALGELVRTHPQRFGVEGFASSRAGGGDSPVKNETVKETAVI